ncbi:hypothetical protein [Parasitella parasitica]|uniref:Uncharacterized protein n=1 Tax=Parasitella parasitica TaxID=35722 RepID=A0A0B7NKB7_9FUNG|nr:hypothetical protein [Parasitella parasitica]
MTDSSIIFPSASIMSKLAACPTTKLPETTDWIFQDFFNTMLSGEDLLTTSSQMAELLPQEKLTDATLLDLLESAISDESSESWHDSKIHTTDDQLSLPDLEDMSSRSSNSDEEEDNDDDMVMIKEHYHGVTFHLDLTKFSNIAPVLIESTISSCTTMSSEEAKSFRQQPLYVKNISINQTLTKRKSTSSFSSFKSFMSVFHSPKKSKLNHDYFFAPMPKMAAAGQQKKPSFSKRLLKYIKRQS